MKEIIILSHGSKNENSNKLPLKVAREIEKNTGIKTLIANLQLSPPYLDEVIEEEYNRGIRNFIIHPFFLHNGNHVMFDIPEYLEKLKERFGEINFIVTEITGNHPMISKIVEEQIRSFL
ncbi:MAG: CbiX/SirB N-terminal domain-containing protein [Proteobacteria bacterium]|nr:CbiX/SirB N-terminal domain-containing protein [Pseudomonadota bacterium]